MKSRLLNMRSLHIILFSSFFLILGIISTRDLVQNRGGVVGIDWDTPFTPSQMLYYGRSQIYLWHRFQSLSGFPSSDVDAMKINWTSIYLIAGSLGLSGEILSKGILLLYFPLAALNAYLLLGELGISNWPRFLSVIIFVFSPAVFGWMVEGAFLIFLFTYALLPITLFLYLRSRNNKFRFIYILGIIICFLPFPVYISIFTLIFIFIEITFRCITTQSSLREYINELLWLTMLIGLFVLIQSYWILPLFTREELSGGFRYTDYIRIETFNVFRQLGSFIFEWENLLGRSTPLILLGYIPIFIALSSIIFKPRRNSHIVFVLLTTIGIGFIFLLNITDWVERQVLYLTVFRDTSKIYALLNVSSLVLIGFVFKELYLVQASRILKILIFVPVVFYLSLYLKPYWNGSIESSLSNLTTPTDSEVVLHWAERQDNSEYKTLWLPTGAYRINQIISVNHPEPYYSDVFAYSSGQDGNVQSVNYRHSLIADFWLVNQFYDLVSNKNLGKLLGLFGVDHIFFRQDHQIQNWASPYSARQWSYSTQLLRENLRRIDSINAQEQFGFLTVYKNNFALPMIHTTQRLHALSGDLKHFSDLLRSEEYEFGNESFAIVDQNPNLSDIDHLNSLILADGNIIDLVLQLLPPNNARIIEPGSYIQQAEVEDGNWASVHQHYWADPYQRTTGEAAIAHTTATLKIPIQIQRNDEYVFWGKVYFGPEASQITLNLTPQNHAKTKTATIVTKSENTDSFKWVEINKFWSEREQDPYLLDQGSYELEIQNHPGWNVISELAIVPRKDLDLALLEAKDFIQATGTNHIFTFVGNESTKDIFIPEDERYSIRVHRVPNPIQSPVYIEGKDETNWKEEINNWQIFPSENSSSQVSTDLLNPPIFVFEEGFYPPEVYFGFDRRWGSNKMRVLAINPNRKTLHGNLQFSALTPPREFEFLFLKWPQQINREFEIWVNGNKVGKVEIASSEDLYADLNLVEIPDLVLKPGANEIELVALQGTSPLELMREYKGDNRQVSIQILDDMQFSISDQQINSTDFSFVTPPLISVNDDELKVSLNLSGDNQDKFALLSRDIDLDIEEYPDFRITYQVENPSYQGLGIAAGIDLTGDQQIDDYLFYSTSEYPNSEGLFEVNINFLDAVKSKFPIDYANKKVFQLKKVFIILHKQWEADIPTQMTSRLWNFNIGDIQFFSEFSLFVPKSNNLLGTMNGNELNSIISEVKNVTPEFRTTDGNELLVALDFQSPLMNLESENLPSKQTVKLILKDGTELTGEIDNRNGEDIHLENVEELDGAEITIQPENISYIIGEQGQKIRYEQEYVDLSIPLSKPIEPSDDTYMALDYKFDDQNVQSLEMKLGIDSDGNGETDEYIYPFKQQNLNNWTFLGSFGDVDLYQTILPITFPEAYNTQIGTHQNFIVEKDGTPLQTTWKHWIEDKEMVSLEDRYLTINLPRGEIPSSVYSMRYAPNPIKSHLYPSYLTFESRLFDALEGDGYTVIEVIVRLKRNDGIDVSKIDGQGPYNFFLRDLRFYDKCAYSFTNPRCYKQHSDDPLIQVLGRKYTSKDTETSLVNKNGYWDEIGTDIFFPEGYHINGLELFPDEMYSIDIVELVHDDKPSLENLRTTTSFYKVNPTRYVVGVDTGTPFHLVFSETYHDNWKAYILNDGPTSSGAWYEWSALLTWLMDLGKRTEINDHYLVNAYANGWYVPKTGNYTIILEYTPQRLFEIGGIISFITLLGCIGYLVWDWKRRR